MVVRPWRRAIASRSAGSPAVGGVARAPAPQAALGLVDDRGRGIEVRVADAQHDHVLAGIEAPFGVVVNLPHPGGVGVEAAGEGGEAHPVPRARLHSPYLVVRGGRRPQPGTAARLATVG